MTPNKITLHHSLTRDTGTASWPVIHKYHTQINGWSDIGYHFGIENIRGKAEILMGRMPDRQGAHVRGHNRDNIGICFVGNYDDEFIPDVLWEAGVRLCKFLVKKFGITEIVGHRELDPRKSCPGNQFDLDRFRKEVLDENSK